MAGAGGLREIRWLRAQVGDAVIREVLERTSARALSPQRIYLAGGTGLAPQLGHRRSFDFDWFRAAALELVEGEGDAR